MPRRTLILAVVVLLLGLAALRMRQERPADTPEAPDGRGSPTSTAAVGRAPVPAPATETEDAQTSPPDERALSIEAADRLADALGGHLTVCDLSAIPFGGRANTAASSPFERLVDGSLLRVASDPTGSQVVFDTDGGVPAAVLIWEATPAGTRCRVEPVAVTEHEHAPADGAWVRFEGDGCTDIGVWTLPHERPRTLGIAQVGRCVAIATLDAEVAVVDLHDPPLDDQGRVRWDFGPPSPFEGGGVVFGDGTAVAPFDVALDAPDLPADVRAMLESWRMEAEARDAFARQTEALWAEEPPGDVEPPAEP